MPGKAAEEIRIAKNGSIQVAPVGADLPDGTSANDVTSALVGFTELGYADESGVVLTVTPDILEIPAWQARTPVRRDLQAQALTSAFTLIQFAAAQVQLAFGGGDLTEPSAGVYRYDFPTEEDALDERALVVDWEDGGSNYRVVVPRGNVTDAVSTNLVRSNAAMLPVTHSALEPDDGGLAYILSDDPAFAPIGSGS